MEKENIMLDFLIKKFGYNSIETVEFCHMLKRGATTEQLYEAYKEYMGKDAIKLENLYYTIIGLGVLLKMCK